MRPTDPFSMTDKLAGTLLDAIAARLERRALHPLFSQMLDDYLDAMEIDRASAVIDLGCGTGVAARAIARRAGFSGSVLGIDLSPALVDAASRLALEEGLGDRVTFAAGDSRHLNLADNGFDAAVAHTLLSHVDSPRTVLSEMTRLVRPGGLIAVFDGDYRSITFGNADSDKGKVDDEAVVNGVVTSPAVMRQMPLLLRQAGLERVAVLPYVLAEVGQADYWASAIDTFERLLPGSGAMTAEYAARWAADLRGTMAQGTFFGACNFYAYIARKT